MKQQGTCSKILLTSAEEPVVDVPGEGRGGVGVEVEHVPVGVDVEEGAPTQKRLRIWAPTPRTLSANGTPPPAAMEGLAMEERSAG